MKTFYLQTLAILFLLFTNFRAQAQIKGQWHFDEQSGPVSADSSGNNLHASLANVTRSPGVRGSAIDFTSAHSLVTFPAGISGAGFPESGTVAFWIKGNFSTQSQRSILENWRMADHIFIRTGTNTNELQIVLQQSNSNYSETHLLPIEADTWTHVAVTWDTKNHMVYIYKNASLVESRAIVKNWFNGSGDPILPDWKPNAQNFEFGGRGSSFIGSLDELLLSDVPMSPIQVQQLYNLQTINAFDTTTPTTPGAINASGISSTITRVSWDLSTDNGDAGIAGYLIFRDGVPVHTVPASAKAYTNFSGLVANTSYAYQIVAFDYNGNSSLISQTANASTTSGNTFFATDFESEVATPEALIYPWTQHGANHNSVAVTTEKSRAGNKAVKFKFAQSEWSSGNPEWTTTPQNLRAEILASPPGPTNLTLGKSWWLGFSEFIPADWKNDYPDNQELIWQLHGAVNGPSAGSPPLSAVITGGVLEIHTRTGKNPSINGEKIIVIGSMLIPKGVWSDWVINCKFDYTNGYIKIWRNGVLVCNYTGPNLYPSIGQTNENGPYLKLGIYKWFWGSLPTQVTERTLFVDEVKAGNEFAKFNDVNPRGANDSAFVDNIPPSITLNGLDTIVISENGTYTEEGATASDLNDGVIAVATSGSVNTSIAGYYIISYTATDISRNIGTRIRIVKVLDQTPPVITLIGNTSITTAHGATFIDPGATAYDGKDGTIAVTVSGTVNTSQLGTYSIVYKAEDAAGNIATVLRNVTVTDQTAPIINISGFNAVTIAYGAGYTDAGASALDAVDGVVPVTTTGTVNPNALGSYNIVYSATDNAGNAATATRVITVKDQVAPVITLNGNSSLTIAHGASFTDPGATAFDEIDGTVAVSVSGTVNTNVVGTYHITYSAKDASGNVTTATRNITVTDQTAPVVTINGSNTITIAHGSTYADAGASAVDAVDGGVLVTKTGTVNSNVLGTYHIVYSSTDNAGNAASSTRTVIVTDQAAPVITLNGPDPVTIALGTSYTDAGASAIDAIDGTVALTKTGTVNSSIAGTYTITYTAKDRVNNTSTKTRTVYVKDVTPPVLSTIKATPTKTAVTITWKTNEISDSQVKYGRTTTYGSLTPVSQTSGVLSHSVTINNLLACTTYNYVVISTDPGNNTVTSSNQSFKTACK